MPKLWAQMESLMPLTQSLSKLLFKEPVGVTSTGSCL